MRIWTITEIVQGILDIIPPPIQGMVACESDFVYELGCSSDNEEFYLQTGLQAIILLTRSQGGIAIDGVHKKFKDEVGLSAEYKRGVALRFYGKSLGQLPSLA